MDDRAPVKFAYIRSIRGLYLKTQKDAAFAEGRDPEFWSIEGKDELSIHSQIGTAENRALRHMLNEVTDKLREIVMVVQEFEARRNCKSGDDMLEMY